MNFAFDKINPKFRELTDLLCFSNRLDLDLKDYRKLLQDNREMNLEYLKFRFAKSTDVFWDNGPELWQHRLSFFLSLEDKALSNFISEHLEKRLFQLIKFKYDLSLEYDIELIQYLELCKVKRARGESLATIRNQLSNMPSYTRVDKLIKVINAFIPTAYKDMDEYIFVLARKISHSSRNFELLRTLEKGGLTYDKQPIVELAFDIIENKASVSGSKYRTAFLSIIDDEYIIEKLKDKYTEKTKKDLLNLIKDFNFRELESDHLKNFKNLIKIDSSLAEELTIQYANSLYLRSGTHKRANIDRLIRLAKTISEVSAKKILAYLSTNNKVNDIKYLLSSFPELNILAAFV